MFETHKLNEQGFAEVKALKSTMAKAYFDIIHLMPEGREKACCLSRNCTSRN